jgi:hypothetical protein
MYNGKRHCRLTIQEFDVQEEFPSERMTGTSDLRGKSHDMKDSRRTVKITKVEGRVDSGKERPIEPTTSLRDQLGHSIGYIGDSVGGLDVVQNPLATSFRYQLPAQDPIWVSERAPVSSAEHLPSAKYMFAALAISKRQTSKNIGTYKIPASEPCIVSPIKYCFKGPLPLSSFSKAIYCYVSPAQQLRSSH